MRGASDNEHMDFAGKDGRVIFTQDVDLSNPRCR